VYEKLRETISWHIIASIFRALTRINVLSAAGYRRILLNLKIVKRAFGAEPKEMWKLVSSRLLEFPVAADTRLIDADNRVYEEVENDMDLQLRALWGLTAAWI
jgi:hypothetical protein